METEEAPIESRMVGRSTGTFGKDTFLGVLERGHDLEEAAMLGQLCQRVACEAKIPRRNSYENKKSDE